MVPGPEYRQFKVFLQEKPPENTGRKVEKLEASPLPSAKGIGIKFTSTPTFTDARH
jgi:hypothetical protein